MTRHTARNSVADVFRDRLRQAQEESGLTNEQLARDVGVTLRLVQAWRSGPTMPRNENLASLAVVLQRPVAFFFGDGTEVAA